MGLGQGLSLGFLMMPPLFSHVVCISPLSIAVTRAKKLIQRPSSQTAGPRASSEASSEGHMLLHARQEHGRDMDARAGELPRQES